MSPAREPVRVLAESPASPGPRQGADPLVPAPRAATQIPHAVTPARVELRIDQLVLEGVERADAPAVAAAVERELGRLLRADQGWGRSVSRDRIDAGAIDLPGRGSPDLLGARIARAVHRGMMGGQGR